MGHRFRVTSIAAAVASSAAAGALALSAGIAGASTVPPADSAAQERVADALQAFDTAAVEAGFAADGSTGSITDPIGLTPVEEPGPVDECIAGFGDTVTEDGTFTGQLAGLTSADYYFTDGAPLPTDEITFDLDTLEASVAIIDPSAHEGLVELVEAFSDQALADCLTDAFTTMADEADLELTSMQVTAEPIDLGVGGALVHLGLSAEQEGKARSTTTAFGIALLPDAIAVVTLDSTEAEPPVDVIETGLAAIVSSLAG